MNSIFLILFYFLFIICLTNVRSSNEKQVTKVWSRLNLPRSHMPHYFFSHKSLRNKCIKDENCPFKSEANMTRCWGYEQNCNVDKRDFLVECPDDSKGWVN